MREARRKQIAELEAEEQERSVWAARDSAVVDWEMCQSVGAVPNLRPTLRTVSLAGC